MFWRKWFSGTKESLQDELKVVILTDTGQVRSNNEDSAKFIKPSRRLGHLGYLGILADGMGGHHAGEVASSLAVETIAEEYYKKGADPETGLYIAFSKANRQIWHKAKTSPAFQGMGTTCTAVVIFNRRVYLAHIGDSRLYLFKEGMLTQLSTDHTYVQDLLKQGVITPEEAQVHRDRNVLTRVMGTHYSMRADILEIPQTFEKGDRLLLCSDGLYDYFSREELAEFLAEPLLSVAAQNLVDAANRRGGYDNITLVLIEKVPSELAEPLTPTRETYLP